MSTLDEYLSMPYRVELTPDHDDEGRTGWVAEIAELPGCVSQGESVEDAVKGVRDAMAAWISVALEDGREIPRPQQEVSYSGRFVVRLPVSLHAELARRAELEGVSLNQFVSAALAGAVHWREREPVAH